MKTEQQVREEVERTRKTIQDLQRRDYFDPVYPLESDKIKMLVAAKRQLYTLLWVLEEAENVNQPL